MRVALLFVVLKDRDDLFVVFEWQQAEESLHAFGAAIALDAFLQVGVYHEN